MAQNETSDLPQTEEKPAEQPVIPAFQFPFSPEAYAPKDGSGPSHGPRGSKGDPHHQGRIYHRRGSHKVLGKR